MVDYLAVTEAVATSSKAKTRKTTYNHWSNKDRFTIGKYSAENGHAATVRKFSSKEKPLNESTVRRFCKHCKDVLKQSMKEKREMKQELLLEWRGRPLMLGSLDEMVEIFTSLQKLWRSSQFSDRGINGKGSYCPKSSAEFGPYRPRFVILGKKPFPKNRVYAKNENNW